MLASPTYVQLIMDEAIFPQRQLVILLTAIFAIVFIFEVIEIPKQLLEILMRNIALVTI